MAHKAPRVIVCGGRGYSDKKRVWVALDGLMPSEIAQGGANGADYLAKCWAIQRRVKVRTYHANWDMDGPAAGPVRNQLMLDDFRPDMVLAFMGGKGTEDMVKKSLRAGVQVIRFP